MKSDLGPSPVLVGAAAIAVFVGLDTTMKFLLTDLPVAQVTFLRYAFAIPFCIAAFLKRPEPITVRAIRANGLRGALIVATAVTFFYGVTILPLAEAIAVQFLAPLFIAVLGRFILREPLHPRILLGIAAGFVGVVVIVRAQIGGHHDVRMLWGFASAVCAAFCYALSNVLLRRQSARDGVGLMVLLQTSAAAVLLIPAGALAWHPIGPSQIGLFVFGACLGTIGQLTLTWAYARAPASRLGVLEYTGFLWASLFGFVVFREVPNLDTVFGAAIIVAACLIALRRPGARRRPA